MHLKTAGRPARILLAEDRDSEADLTRMALEEAKIRHELYRVRDGIETLEFLRQEGAFADFPRPDLILLDLNMPRMDGREVLAQVKADPDLKCIPVVVLSNTDDETEIRQTYDLSANSFVTKPGDYEGLLRVVRTLECFWFSVASLPSETG